MKKVERSNGPEAWRLLAERYEGANASRLHHMLQSVKRPKEFPQYSGGFEVASKRVGTPRTALEALANDILNDAVKRQILLDMAHAGILVQLTLAGHKLCAQRSCRTSSHYGTGTRQRAHRTPLQRQRRWTRRHHRARGRRSLTSRRRSPQTIRPARTATHAASWDTERGTAGTDRVRLRESRMARHLVRERPKAKAVARATAK